MNILPMNKNLHDDNDLFRKAYQSYEDEPSPEVWEKINAQLDKRDALYFKNRTAMWKRITAMLCVLLATFITYELFFAGNRSSSPDDNNLAGKHTLVQQENSAAKKQQDSFAGVHDSIFMTNSARTGLTASKKTGRYAYKKISGIDYKSSFYTLPGKSAAHANDESIAKSEPGNNQHLQDFYNTDSLDETAFSANKINADEKQPAVASEQNNSDTSFNTTNTIAGKTTAPAKQVFSKYWSLTPYVSVDFIGQRLDNDGSFPEPVQPAVLAQREHHEPSFSAGFFAGYHFTKKLSFKTGLLYANSSTAIASQTLHAASDNKGYELITTAGYVYLDKVFGQTAIPGDSVAATNTEHHITSLNIPLMAAYTINPQSRLTVTPGAGIYTHIILGSKIETEIKKDGNRQTVSLTNFKGQRPAYFSFAADAAIGYKINKKLSLAVIPSFNYATTSITSKNAVKTYPYTFRMGAGITWNLED
jgi:hypothetical protein